MEQKIGQQHQQPDQHTRSFQHWDDANWHQVDLSRKESHCADEIMARADLEVRKVAQERSRAQVNSHRQLELRVLRLVFWKREIEKVLDECLEQETCLLKERQHLDEALANLEEPRQVNQECQARRRERQHEDLVEDDVDRRLAAELAVIGKSGAWLGEQRADLAEQLRLCRKHINKLRKDLKLKEEALSTDEECIEKSAESAANPEKIIHSSCCKEFRDTAHWERRNSLEVERARIEVQNCIRGCARSRHTRKCVREDVMRSLLATDQALANRCTQSASASAILEQQMTKTKEQIERIVIKLQEVTARMDDQVPQREKAEKRIKAREEYRPNRERCFDGAQLTLLREVDLLNVSDKNLAEICVQLKNRLSNLRARQEDLKARLDVKKNSADIDEDFCVAQRKNLKYDAFVA